MFFEAILAATAIALCSLVGALFFGNNRKLGDAEKYIIPIAVGVFLSLVLFELIPETIEANHTWGGIVVAIGFIMFYVLSYVLHNYFHTRNLEDKDCDKKGAANLILIGDTIHNFADGVILGSAFLIDPTLGFAVAIGLALHEIPQEIVEFGILIRGGYSKIEAIIRNLFSASSIIIGTIITLLLADFANEYVWIITGIAAGNILYIAATDLLPRIHGNLNKHNKFWLTLIMLIGGFVAMTTIISYAHNNFGHHSELEYRDHAHEEDEHNHGDH